MRERLSALGYFRIIIEIINEIHNRSDIPEDLCRSLFAAMPKKLDANKFELHRTISLMYDIIELTIRIE